jgi:hypothetical protein
MPAIFAQPAPPHTVAMPSTAQDVFLVVMSLFAVATIAFSFYEARQRRDAVPIYLLIGAAIAILYEPLGDALVLAFYPVKNQTGWISMLGHGVPLFIEILYFWYFCPFVLLFVRLARRGFTGRGWWTLWLATYLFCSAFEVLGLHLNTWLYYGPQPLVVLKLPLWVPFTYVSFLFAISAGVTAIVTKLERRHHWLVVPAVPLLLAASHAMTSFPGASALYSTRNHTVILFACLGSVAAAVVMAYALWLPFRRPPTAASEQAALPAVELPAAAESPVLVTH